MSNLVERLTGAPIPLAIVAGAVLLALVVALISAGRLLRHVRKLTVGTVIVQAGVTFAVGTGTYQFCYGVFHLPRAEAIALAVFFEAATWVTIGQVHEHAADPDAVGFGPAGPFFWLFSALGGVLAVLAGRTPAEMLGRAVVVTFGACLWYLQLLRVVRRRGGRAPGATTWLWSPRRLLIWLRVIGPGEHDELTIDRARRVRALTRCGHRAVHWPRPFGALYRSRLAALARTSDEDMLTDAAAQVELGRWAFALMSERPSEREATPEVSGEWADERALTAQQIVDECALEDPRAWGFEALTDPAHYARDGWSPVSPAPYGVRAHDDADGPNEWADSDRPDVAEVSAGVSGKRARRERGMSAAARTWITKAVRAGQSVTGADVAAKYGVSESAGRRWIKTVREDITPKEAAS